jgi:hypothetical protein
VCEDHPDAVIKGQGKRPVQFFITQPVQRILRYKMLLTEVLQCTDEGHPDAQPLRTALDKIGEVAIKINKNKGEFEDLQELKNMLPLFAPGSGLEATLPRLNRRLAKQGNLTKVRLWRRQERHVWLFNDLLLYAEAKSHKGYSYVLKGQACRDAPRPRATARLCTSAHGQGAERPPRAGRLRWTTARASSSCRRRRRCRTPSF